MLAEQIIKNPLLKTMSKVMISFFILVFLLGFFSKSIVNQTLPKVQVVSAANGVVKRTVRVQGVMEPKEIYNVRLDGDVVVESFYVSVGDKVRIGDPLFKVSKGYSSSLKDGIYYSQVGGVILKLSEVYMPHAQGIPVMEIGVVDGAASLKFTASVNEGDVDFIRKAGYMEVPSEDGKVSDRIEIKRIGNVVNSSKVTIVGEFSDKTQRNLLIGQRITTTISSEFKNKELKVIPKCSIIGGDVKEGQDGTVYIAQEQDGILGKEYVAKSVQVKIMSVGDDTVAVSGLEEIEKPQVIKNISYKVTDGAKVLIWK